MNFYLGRDFSDYTNELYNRLESEIHHQNDNYILNVNIDDYTSHLVEKYKIDTPILHFDKVYGDSVEKDIPGSSFNGIQFFVEPSKLYRKQVIIYHIPFTGDINILQLKPNPRVLMHLEANIDNQNDCILIEIINFYDNPDRIKSSFEEAKRDLIQNYQHLRNNCENYNGGLKFTIKDKIQGRKKYILKKNNLLEGLGIPLKTKEDAAKTFSIPNPKLKEKIIVKPKVSNSEFKPEPTLDYDNYRKILKIINDVGKNLERLPSTYIGKNEEDIRDHILLVLDPNFEYGNASGETFNKKGKTDILLNYDGKVVFVAECKYWKGEKSYLKTIDQLLGYLTWRNSKVAVINFVQNSEFSSVLDKIKSITLTHSNFLEELEDTDESWFNYKFHLNGDRNRELELAVISFHLPK